MTRVLLIELASAAVALGLTLSMARLGWMKSVLAAMVVLLGALCALLWLAIEAVGNEPMLYAALATAFVLPAILGGAIGSGLGWYWRRARHGA